MDKVHALIQFINVSRSTRQPSKTAASRLVRASKVLGLTTEEMVTIFRAIDIVEKDGTPFNPDIERVW
jgi:hypothetical protein